MKCSKAEEQTRATAMAAARAVRPIVRITLLDKDRFCQVQRKDFSQLVGGKINL